MLLAFLIPGFSLIGNGRVLLGCFMLVAQCTIIGWPIGIYFAAKNLAKRAVERPLWELVQMNLRRIGRGN